MQIIFKILVFTSDYNTLVQTINRLILARVMSKKIPILYLKDPSTFPGHATKNETTYARVREKKGQYLPKNIKPWSKRRALIFILFFSTTML